MRYRADIDGLRAIAVLPVVSYHLGLPFMPGGFIGVDVFFVISGFLITRIIAQDVADGRFSLVSFYERRARRILPALIVTMMATFAAGLALFMPDEMRDLGYSMAATALLSSNILFWMQTDYFALASGLKPLLHTWSLAVEEHFYIILPLLFMALAAMRRDAFLPLALCALASFILSNVMFGIDLSANYYLLPTRAWELLLGSLLALRIDRLRIGRATAEALSLGGLAMILASAVLLSSASPFPGYNALWPTLGAAMVIAAGERHAGTVAGRLLSLPVLVGVGLISYSLYLVHWPLIVFARYVALRELMPLEQAGLLAVMLIVSALMWRYVERPFRSRGRIGRSRVFQLSGGAFAASLALGGAAVASGGLPQRFDLGKFAAGRPDVMVQRLGNCLLRPGNLIWSREECQHKPGAPRRFVIWGDSHAHRFWYYSPDAAWSRDSNILAYTAAGCLPVIGVDIPGRPYCRAHNDAILTFLKDNNVSEVVMSGYWGRGIEAGSVSVAEIAATVANLKKAGVTVRMIGDVPDFPFANPVSVAYRLHQAGRANEALYLGARNNWDVNPLLRAIPGLDAFLDPTSVLCRTDRRCLVIRDGTLTVTDNAHLSPFGVALLSQQIERLLETRATPN